MNALAPLPRCAETLAELFAPVDAEGLAPLFAEYARKRKAIDELADDFKVTRRLDALEYFVEASQFESRWHATSTLVRSLFDASAATKVLDAEYWQLALDLTDVYNSMPQKRRDEWNEQISERKTPPFEPDTVVATLQDLLAARQRFFAERVDGIFRALSGEHVTNRPEGFSKRMILNYVYGDIGVNSSQAGHINDLRCVVAKFMGRDEPNEWKATHPVIEYARTHHGEWIDVDGGALRIRVYKKGTAHLEVAPEIAYRLNNVLAYLHPHAIASKHRERPKRKPRHVERMQHLLPFAVIEALGKLYPVRSFPKVLTPHSPYDWSTLDKHVREQVAAVLTLLGGTPNESHTDTGGADAWQFDYPAADVLAQVRALGYVPDAKSHQYYPTPPDLARRVVELAQIGPKDEVLEPSAGTGHLARFLPKDRTTCVEVSDVACSVLEAQGFEGVCCCDFLKWEVWDDPSVSAMFDQVVMNPPFDRGQWLAHVEHALGFVKVGGRAVAVLPEGARSSVALANLLAGGQVPLRDSDDPDAAPWRVEWSEPIAHAFAGTSVVVRILTATRVTF